MREVTESRGVPMWSAGTCHRSGQLDLSGWVRGREMLRRRRDESRRRKRRELAALHIGASHSGTELEVVDDVDGVGWNGAHGLDKRDGCVLLEP